MKTIKLFIRHYRILSLTAVIVFIAAIFAVSKMAAHNLQQKSTAHVLAAKAQSTPTPTDTPTITPQPTILYNAIKHTLTPPPVSKQSNTSTPTQSPQNNTLQQATNNNIQSSSTTVTQTPLSSAPTQQPTTVIVQTVHMQITDPDRTKNFDITFKNDTDLCSYLTEARSEGKIQSLALDDSYMSVFNSLYVREMDGFNNNWTFTVNGTSPRGCSLYTPKPNDTIVWKFQ